MPMDNIIKSDIDEKIAKSRSVLKEAVDRFGIEQMAVAITGGKDSTTALWLCRQVCRENGHPLPVCMFIDEGDVFPEIWEFVNHLQRLWHLNIIILKNEDVTSKANAVGDLIRVASLSPANQDALREIDYLEPEFPFEPDSVVCNHLLKTVPMREFIRQHRVQALATAIRWDEADARKAEEYFSERDHPPHVRVHPLLHFRERDIWIAIFKYDVPFNSLYKLGYRSLGARCATLRMSDIPAWLQDLENTPERGGRGEDKEKLMDQLRALGYM